MPGKSRKVGVWIDQRHATIVIFEDDSVDVETVESGLDGRARPAGGARSGTPYGPQDAIKESGLDRRFELQLRAYYEDVLDRIGAATSIFTFGPARARHELIDVVADSSLHRATATETEACDRLTAPQIVARVKEHFGF